MALALISGLIALLLFRVDLRRIGVALFEVELELLLMGLALQLAVMWLKSMKWGLMLTGATGRAVERVFSASMIGFAANLVLPARLGEMARVSVIRNHNHVSVPVALTTLALTQLFDVVVLIAYSLGMSMWATSVMELHRWKVAALGGAALGLLGSLAFIVHEHYRFLELAHAVLRGLPEGIAARLNGWVGFFLDGLRVLSKNHLVGQVMLLTMAAWIVETGAAYVLLLAFRIDATVLMAAILVIVLNLGFAVPITPGNLGITQGLCVLVLGSFGVDETLAWAYAIGAQGMMYVIVLGLGGTLFCREGMHLTDRKTAAVVVKPKPHTVAAS